MQVLIDAAKAVIANWEKGDLAGAVHALEGALAEVEASQPHFVLIQEGGTSMERYVHAHSSAEEAEDDRVSCARASYRTTPHIEVPGSLATHPDFYSTLDALVDSLNELGYVDVPEDDDEETNDD
ncbi:hypothetical protein D9M69_565440 [compost metagenome]